MSITKVTYSMISGAEFNVLDYGADNTGVSDSTSAIQAAIDAAHGSTVYLPSGIYKTTSSINLHPSVTFMGEGRSFPVSAYDPTQQYTGTVINKMHNDHGIVVVGDSPYSESAGIYNISVISQKATYATGDGFQIDSVGSYIIQDCTAWSCGGNGFSLGVRIASDITGQIFVKNLYVNNCGGDAYAIKSRWLRAYNLVSDGCTSGASFTNAPQAYIDGFHFEGFSSYGIYLSGISGYATFNKGFIGLTNPTALYAVHSEDDVGMDACTFDSIQAVGHSGAGVKGFDIASNSINWRISKCHLKDFPLGAHIKADGCVLESTVFDTCLLPIAVNADKVRITDCTTESSTGAYSIRHDGGGLGIWSNNYLDQPIDPVLYGGTNGNFGTNVVVNNTGYKTAAKGETASITSGTVIPHGMSVTPYTVFVQPISPYSIPSSMVVAFDATNITITWTGGGSIQFSWQAFAVCSGQG